jgi:hypothetical protein
MEITKKQLASKRNWNKFRLTGTFILDTEGLTEQEKEIYNKIRELKMKLLDNWDNGSLEIGLHLKPYKCESCGIRSNEPFILKDERTGESHIYCKKHYEIFKDSPHFDPRYV